MTIQGRKHNLFLIAMVVLSLCIFSFKVLDLNHCEILYNKDTCILQFGEHTTKLSRNWVNSTLFNSSEGYEVNGVKVIDSNKNFYVNNLYNTSGDFFSQCPIGQYVYGYYPNGTAKCRSDLVGEPLPTEYTYFVRYNSTSGRFEALYSNGTLYYSNSDAHTVLEYVEDNLQSFESILIATGDYNLTNIWNIENKSNVVITIAPGALLRMGVCPSEAVTNPRTGKNYSAVIWGENLSFVTINMFGRLDGHDDVIGWQNLTGIPYVACAVGQGIMILNSTNVIINGMGGIFNNTHDNIFLINTDNSLVKNIKCNQVTTCVLGEGVFNTTFENIEMSFEYVEDDDVCHEIVDLNGGCQDVIVRDVRTDTIHNPVEVGEIVDIQGVNITVDGVKAHFADAAITVAGIINSGACPTYQGIWQTRVDCNVYSHNITVRSVDVAETGKYSINPTNAPIRVGYSEESFDVTFENIDLSNPYNGTTIHVWDTSDGIRFRNCNIEGGILRFDGSGEVQISDSYIHSNVSITSTGRTLRLTNNHFNCYFDKDCVVSYGTLIADSNTFVGGNATTFVINLQDGNAEISHNRFEDCYDIRLYGTSMANITFNEFFGAPGIGSAIRSYSPMPGSVFAYNTIHNKKYGITCSSTAAAVYAINTICWNVENDCVLLSDCLGVENGTYTAW